MICKLDWDSNFFKAQIGKVNWEEDFEFSALLELAKKYDLIYIFSSEKLNYFHPNLRLVDTKLTFVKLVLHKVRNTQGLTEFVSSHGDIKKLLYLTFLSGHKSRFKNDKFFRENDFLRLYKTWIKRSLTSDRELVLVKHLDDELVGFVSLKLDEHNNGTIELIAVDESYQGLGVGKELIQGVEASLEIGKYLRVSTQEDNVQACRLYENMDFRLEKRIYVYHYGPNSI